MIVKRRQSLGPKMSRFPLSAGSGPETEVHEAVGLLEAGLLVAVRMARRLAIGTGYQAGKRGWGHGTESTRDLPVFFGVVIRAAQQLAWCS